MTHAADWGDEGGAVKLLFIGFDRFMCVYVVMRVPTRGVTRAPRGACVTQKSVAGNCPKQISKCIPWVCIGVITGGSSLDRMTAVLTKLFVVGYFVCVAFLVLQW